jgi:SMC interacting uncharacterized protein involved in chromosome segregation
MNDMSMDEMIEVLARYRYNAKHDADRIKALESELSRLRASSFVTAVPAEEYEKMKAENARLKAEVDRLAMSEGYHYTAIAVSTLKEQLHQKHIDYIEARKANEAKVEMINRLKAEVERLTSVSEAWKKRRLDKVEAECINWADVENENARLKAQVERLTKAGDALENWIAWECESPAGTAEGFRKAWNAAKGVQS